ncbi:MAG: hypothetical protein ACK4NC_04305 [Candidatus Gracilibacteria bacterium]
MKEEFRLASLQLIFFLDIYSLPIDRYISDFISIFDEMKPLLLPLPDDVAPEVPRLIISKPNTFEFKVTRDRLDINYFFTYSSNKLELEENISTVKDQPDNETNYKKDFRDKVTLLFNFINKQELSIKNLGYISSYISHNIQNRNERIKFIFNDSNLPITFDDDSEISLNFLTKSKTNWGDKEVLINKSHLVNTGIVSATDNKRLMLLSTDINTFPTDDLKLTLEKEFLTFLDNTDKESIDFVKAIQNSSTTTETADKVSASDLTV